MYTPTVRIILGLFGLFIAWISYSFGYIEITFLMLSAVGFLVWGYYKYGTVYMAFKKLKRKNYDKAEYLLSKINNPNLLNKKQKSYYHFAKGFIELNKKNIDKSYYQFLTAIELGLRTENDTAVAILNLADIELKRKNYDETRKYLSTLKTLKYKPELEVEIERIQKELNGSQSN